MSWNTPFAGGVAHGEDGTILYTFWNRAYDLSADDDDVFIFTLTI